MGLGDNKMRQRGGVDRRPCVGHRRDSGETTRDRCFSPGSNRFGLLGTRLAQMHVDVKESRSDNKPFRVKRSSIGYLYIPNRFDFSVFDQYVSNAINVLGRIDQMSVLDDDLHAPPNNL